MTDAQTRAILEQALAARQAERATLNEVPQPYRQAIALTELGGLTQKEAAREAGLTLSGMKARVQRGRKKLKEVVLDCCEVELDRRGGLVGYRRRDGSPCGDRACPDEPSA